MGASAPKPKPPAFTVAAMLYPVGHIISSVKVDTSQIILGFVLIEGHIVATHVHSDELTVYDQAGKYIVSVRVPHLRDPWGPLVKLSATTTAVSDTNNTKAGTDLVICDKDGESLHFVTLGPKWKLRSHRVQQLGYQPQSVSLHSTSGHLVTVDGYRHKIHVYNLNGEHQRALALQRDDFTEPVYAAKVTNSGWFVVVDLTLRQLVWIDNTGTIQRVYRGPDQHNPLVNPLTFIKDPVSGHLLVVDGEGSRIHEVNPHGAWVQTLLQEEDGMQYPGAIYLDEITGRLYVAHGILDKPIMMTVLQYAPPVITPVKNSKK